MNAMTSRFIGAGVLFVLVFLSGVWVKQGGKPYAALPFTLHKLIALGALVLLVITINQLRQATTLTGSQIAVVVLAGLFFLAAIVSGGLVSVDKAFPAFVYLLHRLSPYLTVLFSALSLYLLAQAA